MPVNILIVEDDTSLAAMLEIALSAIPGAGLITVHDGREAMRILEDAATSLAVVLTDLDLPRVSGYELIRWMRSRPGLLHVPVVAMSARNDPGGALEAGATRFVSKPYSTVAVRELVEELIHA